MLFSLYVCECDPSSSSYWAVRACRPALCDGLMIATHAFTQKPAPKPPREPASLFDQETRKKSPLFFLRAAKKEAPLCCAKRKVILLQPRQPSCRIQPVACPAIDDESKIGPLPLLVHAGRFSCLRSHAVKGGLFAARKRQIVKDWQTNHAIASWQELMTRKNLKYHGVLVEAD